MRSELRLGAIILGAGASTRMGEPKLLLPWKATSVIGHILETWRLLCSTQITVVCAPEPHPLHSELDRLSVPRSWRIINPMPELGMFSSIQSAARRGHWLADLTHFALILGDQPQISSVLLETLLENVGEHFITQPAVNGRPKHPVILVRNIFEQLAFAKESTLRDFLASSAAPRALVSSVDPSLGVDLDTREDYAQAVQQFTTPSSLEQM